MENNGNKIKASHVIFQLVVFIILAAFGVFIYSYFMGNRPEIKKKKRKNVKALYVDVIDAKKGTFELGFKAMGEVYPARKLDLKSSVSGEIVKVSEKFYPGGMVKKGDVLVWLDKRDYELSVKKYESQVKKAKADLELELGKQKSSAKELELYEKSGMGSIGDKNLALRKPQLESAKAELESAKSDLKKAELDLSRTEIKAPFDAIIVDTAVELGSYLSSQQSIATLYGTKTHRVKAAVPMDRLAEIIKNKDSAIAEITSETSKAKRIGHIKSLSGKVLENSRMAEVLFEFQDPFGIESGDIPLLSGDYVSIYIKLDKVKDLFSIPREALHDNKDLWIFENGRLKIKPVNIFWRGEKNILVKDRIEEGDKIIVSSIPIPVEGMPLKVNQQKQASEKGLESRRKKLQK